MKKFLTLLIAVAGFLSSNAQEPRLTVSAGQVKNITVGDNMKVVLVSSATAETEVKMDANVFEKINISVHNGSMYINPGKSLEKETIYVIVDDIKSLTVGQNAQVTTEGILYSKEIKVFVQEGSLAKLLTTGHVSAFALDNQELSISKTPVRFNASAKNALGL